MNLFGFNISRSPLPLHAPRSTLSPLLFPVRPPPLPITPDSLAAEVPIAPDSLGAPNQKRNLSGAIGCYRGLFGAENDFFPRTQEDRDRSPVAAAPNTSSFPKSQPHTPLQDGATLSAPHSSLRSR